MYSEFPIRSLSWKFLTNSDLTNFLLMLNLLEMKYVDWKCILSILFILGSQKWFLWLLTEECVFWWSNSGSSLILSQWKF